MCNKLAYTDIPNTWRMLNLIWINDAYIKVSGLCRPNSYSHGTQWWIIWRVTDSRTSKRLPFKQFIDSFRANLGKALVQVKTPQALQRCLILVIAMTALAILPLKSSLTWAYYFYLTALGQQSSRMLGCACVWPSFFILLSKNLSGRLQRTCQSSCILGTSDG